MSIKKQFVKAKGVCKVTFSLPKEAVNNGEQVAVLGDFNNWNTSEALEMKKSKDGAYKAMIELESGREYQFRYLFNNERWENDNEADKFVATPFGTENCVIVVA